MAETDGTNHELLELFTPARIAAGFLLPLRVDSESFTATGLKFTFLDRDKCMDVLCSGMYRACSTWQYNVASELVERHGGIRLGFVDWRDYQPIDGDSDRQLRVLKTHDRHDVFATALRTNRALALYSVRDLRDVAFSIMHKFNISFDEVLAPGGLLETCLVNDVFWTSLPNVLVQRYELITENDIKAVLAIAQFIGIDLDTSAASSLAGEYSLDRNRVRTDSLALQLRNAGVDLQDPQNQLRYDPKTLLHWNHLRSGSIGNWRERATPEQKAALARVCGEWLIQRGYETSLSWVEQRYGRYSRPSLYGFSGGKGFDQPASRAVGTW